jgi:hypothetical protein
VRNIMAVVAVLLVILADQVSTDQDLRTLTVCDVLRNRLAYQDKIVAVRGELIRGEEHFYLRMESCTEKLVTSGFRWPDAITLERPGSPLVERAVDYEEDLEALSHISLVLEKVAKSGSPMRVWATFVGKLETRTNFPMVRTGAGQVVGYGFGHLNAFPAQLVYRSVKDIVAKQEASGRPRR